MLCNASGAIMTPKVIARFNITSKIFLKSPQLHFH